ncbi:uncharacterized protein F4822DRAFT_129948 [Hypoxylon trugodes]|uniref:uncharacterized protein n=1 Tax=Hypoxylon trugodes TaxID=326681 RepID=UPI00219B0139|nr:uncharacterized protein F4822DRAFT_129948 [Hypoxylon trugodes]KAI1392463.1 hypothetical protein F4822DRAFT_129948 [Hypoxylon trugodes]
MPGSSKKEAVSRLKCTACHKTYSSISHLRRHEATHNSQRVIVCPSCSKSFVRIDVARRHLRSCVKDDTDIDLPTAKRGKKPKACDRCSQSKVTCNLETPCSRCRSRGLTCSYLRVDDLTAPTSTDSPVTNTDQWLLRMTDPLAGGTAEAVVQDINADSVIDGETMPVSMAAFEDEPFPQDSGAWMSSFYLDPSLDLGDGYSVDVENPVFEPTMLSARLEELIKQLADAHHVMRFNGVTSELDFNIDLARSVFTAQNAEYFLAVCFQHIHPYHPIIHPPTFNCEKVSLPLLLAVFLYGALFSVPLDDAISAHSFFRVAEEYIFNHPDMKRLAEPNNNSSNMGDSLEILQAAFSITVIQNSRNDEITRRRIRVQRHPYLVAATKMTGVLQAKHQLDLSGYTASDWDQFIKEETGIRIAHWIQFSNCFLVCCFNGHAQVYTAEMVGDMPCRREIYEAETVEEFARLLSLEPSGGPQPQSLANAISFLLQDSWPGPDHEVYKRFTPEILAIIINSLGTSIIVARGNGPFSMVSQQYLRACMRWKSLWETLMKKDSQDQRTLTGFVKHAMDFWWFCIALIKAEQSGDLSCHYMTNFGLDSFAAIHEFLRRYKGLRLHEVLAMEKRASTRSSPVSR